MAGQHIAFDGVNGEKRAAVVTKAKVAGRAAPKGVYLVTEETELVIEASEASNHSRRVGLLLK